MGLSLARYMAVSMLAAAAVVYHAFITRQHFYPSTIYLSSSKVAVAAMGNLSFALALCTHRVVIKMFLGSLRDIEQEMIRERLSSAVMESLLALTIFREEFSAFFVSMFASLVFVKVLHWLVQDRVDYVEVTPTISFLQHVRLITFMGLLLLVDACFLQYTIAGTIQSSGQSVMLLFAFEYVILASTVVRYALKYGMSMVDLMMEGSWQAKGTYTFYLELVSDLLHLFVYVTFFMIVFAHYGLPLHLVRDLYSTFRNFRARMQDFLRFRQVTTRLDRFPDATPEDLARCDGVCIICREEMADTGSNKKLFCGHVFHLHCLRSWLERQQNCPTCRASVFRRGPPPAAGQQQAADAAGAAAPAAAAAGALPGAAADGAQPQPGAPVAAPQPAAAAAAPAVPPAAGAAAAARPAVQAAAAPAAAGRAAAAPVRPANAAPQAAAATRALPRAGAPPPRPANAQQGPHNEEEHRLQWQVVANDLDIPLPPEVLQMLAEAGPVPHPQPIPRQHAGVGPELYQRILAMERNHPRHGAPAAAAAAPAPGPFAFAAGQPPMGFRGYGSPAMMPMGMYAGHPAGTSSAAAAGIATATPEQQIAAAAAAAAATTAALYAPMMTGHMLLIPPAMLQGQLSASMAAAAAAVAAAQQAGAAGSPAAPAPVSDMVAAALEASSRALAQQLEATQAALARHNNQQTAAAPSAAAAPAAAAPVAAPPPPPAAATEPAQAAPAEPQGMVIPPLFVSDDAPEQPAASTSTTSAPEQPAQAVDDQQQASSSEAPSVQPAEPERGGAAEGAEQGAGAEDAEQGDSDDPQEQMRRMRLQRFGRL